MCWHTSWDVDCDHCVTAERDYLLFLSRHFIILESDKYPGESRTPHLIMSSQSQCLFSGLLTITKNTSPHVPGPAPASAQTPGLTSTAQRGQTRLTTGSRSVMGQSATLLKSLFSVKTTEYFNVPFLDLLQWYFRYPKNITPLLFEIMPAFFSGNVLELISLKWHFKYYPCKYFLRVGCTLFK